MARVNGRTIIPTNHEELAVLQELGLNTLRASRKVNPYQVARRLERATKPHPDLEYLRSVAARSRIVEVPKEPSSPPSTTSQNIEVAAE